MALFSSYARYVHYLALQEQMLAQDAELLTRERLHRGLGLFEAALLRIQVCIDTCVRMLACMFDGILIYCFLNPTCLHTCLLDRKTSVASM